MYQQMNTQISGAHPISSVSLNTRSGTFRKELSAREMTNIIGGTIVIEARTNTVLIGVGIGAVIGFVVAGPVGAVEGAFWGALVWLLLP